MSVDDQRRARRAFEITALVSAVHDACLELRNMAAELVAVGLDREGKRLRTIAALLDSAEDPVDAVEFCLPSMRSIAWRLYEAQAYQQAQELQAVDTSLSTRCDWLQESTGPIALP